MTTTNVNEDILTALLSAEDSPEKDVFMQRFGVAFRIKAVSIKQIKRLQLQATHVVGKTEILDEEYFAALLIVDSTVNVEWRNPKLLARYEVTEAAEVVQKRLLSGEIAFLAGEILDVSGFNQDARINNLKN
ncbi:MAG: phage tail assembly chaperone [Bacillota bacterium]